MTWLYGGALVLGMLALIAWALLQSSSGGDTTATSDKLVPQLIAGAVAFGMGGMSASYAGWNPWAAAGASLTAAALGVLLARSRPMAGDRNHD
jgi:hypothetical protein